MRDLALKNYDCEANLISNRKTQITRASSAPTFYHLICETCGRAIVLETEAPRPPTSALSVYAQEGSRFEASSPTTDHSHYAFDGDEVCTDYQYYESGTRY